MACIADGICIIYLGTLKNGGLAVKNVVITYSLHALHSTAFKITCVLYMQYEQCAGSKHFLAECC
jgi:hypothetical protein